jgi:HEAT repeat protein
MNMKRLYLLMLLLVIGCQSASGGAGQDKPATLVSDTLAEIELNEQLEINRDALLQGSSEQIRIKAAAVMLFSKDASARKILLGVLRQSENSAARGAVCKALNQARASQESVSSKRDFIQPLLEILTGDEDFAEAKPVAEALLIFKYEDISEQLKAIVTDTSLSAGARLNVIYVLQLQPDIRAIFEIMNLLDDPDKAAAAEAEKALRSLGIPVGEDAEARRQIKDELERKGRDEFLRDWLIRQESRANKLEAELDMWRQLYLSALDKIYDGISDDTVRGIFLAEHLGSSKVPVRLWALEKVVQWRKGTSPKLPAELEPILVNLISDQDRDVRLKTAGLLSLMGELNSAGRLAKQLESEQDEEVKMELFVALGAACYYAFLPNSGIEISPEIRKQTLELAVKYLADEEPKKAQKGAEVIKKLLEQDGLTSAEVDRYLDLLAERYERQKNKDNGALRGELLNAMAGLCAQSVYRDASTKRFAPLFEESLRDETDLVREAAVVGLVYIDKTRALNILRKDFVNDGSIIVRKKLINLAGEVGGKEDLIWLIEKIGSTAESEPAWQATLRIFKRSGSDVINDWLSKFDSQSTKARLSDEQMLTFLEIAERKTVGENKIEMLKVVREKLAGLHKKIGNFGQAAEYLGKLRETAQSPEEKEKILVGLLEVYLIDGNIKSVKDLVHNRLLEGDLDPNSVVVRTIDGYIHASKPSAGIAPYAMLEVFSKMETPEVRPMWAEQMKCWTDRLGQAEDPNN